MTRVAFLGLGAMGVRMAQRLMDARCALTVWNRHPERAEPLARAGAAVARTPSEAAADADVVISMVRDDAASAAVWLDAATGALAAMGPTAVGVECSTLTIDHVRHLAEAFRRAGRPLLDAPVAGSRPQAEAGQLIFLVGGAPDSLERVRPLLDAMGGAVHHAGGNGAGATLKLMVNALYGTQLAAVAELLGLAAKAGIDTRTAADILGTMPVCSPAARLAAAMLAGNFAPAFPIDLVEKDLGMVESSAGTLGAPVPLSAAVRRIYADAKAAGLSDDNITGIARRYL